MTKSEEKLKKLVNASGYLFQLKVQTEIHTSKPSANLAVISSEHRWIDNESGEEGFIDIGTGDGEGIGIAMEAGGIAFCAQGCQDGSGEVGFEVGGVIEVRSQVEEVAAEGAEVGDAG